MGEMADYYIDSMIHDACTFGDGRSYNNGRNLKGNNYNSLLSTDDYRKVINYLTRHLKIAPHFAKQLIVDNLIKEGKLPIPARHKFRPDQITHLKNLIRKAGLQLEGEKDVTSELKLEAEKELVKMAYESEVSKLFKVERGEEGEKSLVIERGMNKEVVAVSFSYPHYRREGFYAGRKSSVFSTGNDTEKMLISMERVFESLATVLNNLQSADLLYTEAYNNIMDGFKPFIYEALDFEEIEPMLGNSSGLKEGRKKRISNKFGKRSAKSEE